MSQAPRLLRMCAAMAAVTPLLGADCDNGTGGPTPTPTPVCSPTTITPVNVAPGVDYYDCSASTRNVRVVTINRNRGGSEMWILDDPTAQPGTLNLRTVARCTVCSDVPAVRSRARHDLAPPVTEVPR